MPAIIASRQMTELMTMVDRVAMSNASVLVTGESGSGKELVARALHHGSMRSSKPWVDVNCGALPEHLMESELFGHEKGAFSGADSAKQGLFELAHGGTLFLDEVGELESRMQVKLLRVLDGAPYYRLGGVRKVSVDVRIVAATNQSLETMVQQGRFRGDLFHRLSQICLHVPPLRDRAEDIVPLAEFFLEQQNPRLELADSARERLLSCSWSGNIRELRNVITKAAILVNGNLIRAEHIHLRAPAAFAAPAGQPQAPANLDRMEESMIQRVLEQTGGHQQRAAALLGISRRTLSRKLKSYGLRTTEEHCA
ncbi:MAG TPA: sigma-54 dependent transcriptional regulator [Bryobacteraceae bacterium]|jgi:two-component system response regulator AtoC